MKLLCLSNTLMASNGKAVHLALMQLCSAPRSQLFDTKKNQPLPLEAGEMSEASYDWGHQPLVSCMCSLSREVIRSNCPHCRAHLKNYPKEESDFRIKRNGLHPTHPPPLWPSSCLSSLPVLCLHFGNTCTTTLHLCPSEKFTINHVCLFYKFYNAVSWRPCRDCPLQC